MWFLLGFAIAWYVLYQKAYLVRDALWVIKQRKLHARKFAIVNADGCYIWCACAACRVASDFQKMVGMTSWGQIKARKSYRWEAAEECDHPSPCFPESIPPSAKREQQGKETI